jgi:hypothetical protein
MISQQVANNNFPSLKINRCPNTIREDTIECPISVRLMTSNTRSYRKKRILVQGQGGPEVQPAGILKYSEELKRGPNTEIGPKDFFEIASN